MNAPLPLSIVCKTCQIAVGQGTQGAYDIFGCIDCRVRYLLDCAERLSPNRPKPIARKTNRLRSC